MKKTLITAVLLLLTLGAFVWWQREGDTPTQPLQTATTTVSTTTAMTPKEFFAQEPIIPEAKVSTEGWKTCRNEEYGYEFQFPPEWYVYGEGAYSQHAPILLHPTQCDGERVLVSSTYYTNDKHEDKLNILKRSISIRRHTGVSQGIVRAKMNTIEELASIYKNGKRKKCNLIILDGSTRALCTQLPQSNFTDLEFFHNGYLYEIIIDGNVGDKYYSTILSTFHFLDTESSTESEE